MNCYRRLGGIFKFKKFLDIFLNEIKNISSKIYYNNAMNIDNYKKKIVCVKGGIMSQKERIKAFLTAIFGIFGFTLINYQKI